MALLAAALENGRDVLGECHWLARRGWRGLLASGGSDRRCGNEDSGERLHRNLLGGRDDEDSQGLRPRLSAVSRRALRARRPLRDSPRSRTHATSRIAVGDACTRGAGHTEPPGHRCQRSPKTQSRGEDEGLAEKLANPEWAPDCGPAVFNPRLGATVVGAREFLIAYNVNLNTRDRRLAHEIALNIREAGRLTRDERGNVAAGPDGTSARTPGRLKATRAIGWYIEEYRQAQVSINLLDFRTTPLHVVYETVKQEAERLGLRVTGSELIGMTPRQPILDAGRFYLREQRKSAGAPESELVDIAIRSMGLDQLAPFDPGEEDRRVCRSPATAVDVAAGRWLRGPGVERHTGSRRRLGGRTGRQPGRGARRDGRQSHGRAERS